MEATEGTQQDFSELPIKDGLLDELNTKQLEIISYLFSITEDQNEAYTRSKNIAKEIGLSSREVGTNLNIAREKVDSLTVEKWGRSNSTTWKISRS